MTDYRSPAERLHAERMAHRRAAEARLHPAWYVAAQRGAEAKRIAASKAKRARRRAARIL